PRRKTLTRSGGGDVVQAAKQGGGRVTSFGAGGRPDYWPARAGHLARLISADALFIVAIGAGGQRIAFALHNLREPGGDATDVDARPLPIVLADGRAARHRFAVPLIWKNRVFGSVVGFRVERAWDSESLDALTRAAGLVAID